jgi:hypothetical protein
MLIFRSLNHKIEDEIIGNSSLFNEFVCKLGFFWHEWASLKRE